MLAAVSALALGADGHASGTPGGRVPVVVELFTSEGCSSCPPADQVLANLVATQPVDGAEIIALGEHVDYWDHQGWRDPFSSAWFTARQSEYDTKVFRLESIYTPQLVVDGRQQLVGSDGADARRAIARAARERSERVRVAIAGGAATDGWRVDVSADGDSAFKAGEDVMLGVTEDGLVSHVKRGENSGRALRHVAVVRALSAVGELPPGGRSFSLTRAIGIDPAWQRPALHVVAFVQDRRTRQVLGAATLPVPWQPQVF